MVGLSVRFVRVVIHARVLLAFGAVAPPARVFAEPFFKLLQRMPRRRTLAPRGIRPPATPAAVSAAVFSPCERALPLPAATVWLRASARCRYPRPRCLLPRMALPPAPATAPVWLRASGR